MFINPSSPINVGVESVSSRSCPCRRMFALQMQQFEQAAAVHGNLRRNVAAGGQAVRPDPVIMPQIAGDAGVAISRTGRRCVRRSRACAPARCTCLSARGPLAVGAHA